MTASTRASVAVARPDRFFIGGQWVAPSSDDTFEVVDPSTEEVFLTVAQGRAADMSAAVGAASEAFHEGPWPTLSHVERAGYVSALAEAVRERIEDLTQIWPRQSGILYADARAETLDAPGIFDYYAGLAETYRFEEEVEPSYGGGRGLLVREPVGVVGIIIPWNAPLSLLSYKLAPALLAGCTVVVKPAPEAPGEAYILTEAAEKIGLPAGVLNLLTADREVSEQMVVDTRVDKIAFTGSTAAGRRIASLCGERIARYTLELGGKSAAVVLDDADLTATAETLSNAGCLLSGQICSSLTRVVVTQDRHDDLVEALAENFSAIQVGDPFEPSSQMGPLAMERQRDRVEGYIRMGVDEGATLVTGGGRPPQLDRGFFIEPTVFANVDNSSTIAREEIFGPVISVISAKDEDEAVRIANDSIYGLNSSVFTSDVGRARQVAAQLRSGTVGHNSFRSDFGIAFGGFKQSGVGREGGTEGLRPYLETKTVILDDGNG